MKHKKLSTYIDELTEILNTEGDMDIIYSSDDEGNGYSRVHYDPSVVLADEMISDVINVEEQDEEEEYADYKKVVCIN